MDGADADRDGVDVDVDINMDGAVVDTDGAEVKVPDCETDGEAGFDVGSDEADGDFVAFQRAAMAIFAAIRLLRFCLDFGVGLRWLGIGK